MNFDAFDQHYSAVTALKLALANSLKRIPRVFKFIFVFMLVLFVALGFLVVSLFVVSFISQPTSFNLGVLMPIFLLISFIGVIVWMAIKSGKRLLTLKQFCVDNKLNFNESVNLQDHSGSIFTKGYANAGSNEISGSFNGANFSLFDYRYTTGSGKNQRTYTLGVTQINLSRKFPHILLDNKKDSSVSGFEFDNSQKLELEGDFNKIFNVYGPKEYEIEVLQILNPHVMRALIDMPEAFDIEIIGNKLYIYNFGHSDKKKTYQAIFSAIEQLSSSTRNVQQTFTMPEQIGDYKPILKRSIWPKVIGIGVILVYLAIQILRLLVASR